MRELINHILIVLRMIKAVLKIGLKCKMIPQDFLKKYFNGKSNRRNKKYIYYLQWK